MQLQKPSGPISESLENIWIYHEGEYHLSIQIPTSLQIGDWIFPKKYNFETNTSESY